MSIRPIRNEILVERIAEPDEIKLSGETTLYLPQQRLRENYHRARVLAVGKGVQEEIVPGDILWILGVDAGTRLGDNQFIVTEDLALAVEYGH